jgi:hypothetical protein
VPDGSRVIALPPDPSPLSRYDRCVTNHLPATDMPSTTGATQLALLQSLADTVTQGGADQIGTREEAVPWLRACGLLPDDGAISGSEHNALVRLRDALRDTFAARAAGKTDEDAAGRLTRALADGRLVVTISPAGKAQLASSARAPYSNAVAAIAIAIAESLG